MYYPICQQFIICQAWQQLISQIKSDKILYAHNIINQTALPQHPSISKTIQQNRSQANKRDETDTMMMDKLNIGNSVQALKEKNWQRLRHRQIQQIKDNIRNKYIKQQDHAYLTPKQYKYEGIQDYGTSVQEFKSRHGIGYGKGKCSLCSSVNFSNHNNGYAKQDIYKCMRYQVPYCQRHQLQLINHAQNLYMTDPQALYQLYPDFEAVESLQLVNIQRTMHLLFRILSSANPVLGGESNVSEWVIVKSLLDGWLEYRVTQLCQSNIDTSRYKKQYVTNYLNQCKRLTVLCCPSLLLSPLCTSSQQLVITGLGNKLLKQLLSSTLVQDKTTALSLILPMLTHPQVHRPSIFLRIHGLINQHITNKQKVCQYEMCTNQDVLCLQLQVVHWYLRTYVDVYASADSLGGLDGGVCEILMDGTMAVEGAQKWIQGYSGLMSKLISVQSQTIIVQIHARMSQIKNHCSCYRNRFNTFSESSNDNNNDNSNGNQMDVEQ